jgi:hypothetical protein
MKYIANPVEVEAQEIVSVGPILEDGSMHCALRDGTNFTADKGMLARFTPSAGDYVVTQADGYVYLNPKDVFERKYRPAVATLESLSQDVEDAQKRLRAFIGEHNLGRNWWSGLMPSDEVEGPKNTA